MTFIFHPAFIQHTSYCAKAKPYPAHARASGLEPSGSALRTAAHAIKALCLYCVTGDEPSPDVLTRLLESNRKSIRIPLPRGTGDPLHAVFEIVQQLALQGHPVPLDLLLLRKSFLTLDGITRRLDPDFNAWVETLVYASGVFASEAVVRTWSIQFPWLDRPDFYRSGLPTRTLAAQVGGTIQKKFVRMQKLVGAFRKSVRCSVEKLFWRQRQSRSGRSLSPEAARFFQPAPGFTGDADANTARP